MTQLEIRSKIDDNNSLIEKLYNPKLFTLNSTIAQLLNENEILQSYCIHEFDNGRCKWCDKEAKNEN